MVTSPQDVSGISNCVQMYHEVGVFRCGISRYGQRKEKRNNMDTKKELKMEN